ncbi:hypothetical protein PINS_up002877 [Pythium insidiosum]|nr:hypothetical protein PINS_up002877 [Pythium insidiosum]
MAAGVQIVWYIAHGLNALNMVTLPEDKIERQLMERGYCVKNMSPENAIISVVGWAFICPLLVGYLLASCIPSAHPSWFESFWMGYLIFNLFAWFVCCFPTRRRIRRRRPGAVDPIDDFEDDLMGEEDELGMGMVFDMDDHDHDHDHDFDDDDDEDDDGIDREGDGNQDAGDGDGAPAAVDGFIGAMRKSYKELMFNVHVHDNDGVRLGTHNIRAQCFDVNFFVDEVLLVAVITLLKIVAMCTIQSFALVTIWSYLEAELPQATFAISVFTTAISAFLLQSHAYIFQWLAAFAESIRNERYLIGRELQDMVR